MSSGRFVWTRLALALVTLVVISGVTFFATNVVPSDPARVALGKFATQEQLDIYTHEQGLDRPVAERYFTWVGHVVQGDWGHSVLSQQDVSDLVVPRIARSAILAFVSMLLAVPLAFMLGVFSGQRAGRPSDLFVSIGALLLNALPEFVVGIALLMVFAVWTNVLPVESSGAALGEGWTKVEAYILPVMTLTLVLVPYMARMVRANVREVSSQPFVRSAALRGLSRRRLMWRHVVPNATLPVVNVVALSLAELIGGVVIIETVFGFPGIGQLLVSSVSSKDIPTVQVITLIMGVAFIVLNIVADGVILILNPRLRAG